MCWRKLFSFLSVFFCAHKIIHEEMSVFTFREFSYSLLHAKIGLNGIVKQSYFVRWAGRVWKSLPCSSSCIQLRTISWVFSSFSSSNGSRCYLVKQTVAKLISVKLRLNWFFFSLCFLKQTNVFSSFMSRVRFVAPSIMNARVKTTTKPFKQYN